MTKEQFIDKWMFGSNPLFESDLKAVIATEIEKVWELEPVQGIPQPEQPAKPFDKDRFEAMFRAAIAVGKFANFSDIILWVETSLQQLDAYYASKNN